nr:TonB-dependent receptor [Acinetobacter sp.]
MSPSPAAFNTSSPMKKKIITALVAVVIGHVGVLWAVSHIKTIELKPIEKEPLKV